MNYMSDKPTMHLRLKDCKFHGKFICREENNNKPIKISGNKFLKMQPKKPSTIKL